MLNKLLSAKYQMNHFRTTFQIVLFQHVKVLDRNDNKPEFVKKFYDFYVDENAANQTLTLPKIEVFDVDTSDLNSHLKFRLVDKHHNLSRSIHEHLTVVDTENNFPLLFINRPFDYETDGERIEFDLIAYDIDNLTDVCTITIYLRDLNDNSPLFINENSTFTIRENSAPNSFIGQVIAVDKDSPGPNSDISYRIASEHLKSQFKIYKTGVLSNWAVFDRESRAQYVLTIEAYNSAMPSLSCKAVYYIRVEDENDNRPRILHPRENSSHLTVNFPRLNFLPNATNLIRLFDAKAVDDDADENGRLNYYMNDSIESLLIDQSNGSVYFDFFKWNITDLSQLMGFKRTIGLSMRVCDSGVKVTLCSEQNVTLYLNYDKAELDLMLPVRLTGEERNERDGLVKLGGFFDSNVNEATLKKNFFQLVSNSVLIIILLTVLMFMLFVACFLFIIFYKKNYDRHQNVPKFAPPNAPANNYHFSASINTIDGANAPNKYTKPSSTRFIQCFSTVTDRFRGKCNVTKTSSFKNIAPKSNHEENLTVNLLFYSLICIVG